MSDLRNATRDAHQEAEETGISKMLVSADFTANEWIAFLSNQYQIRNAIENLGIIKEELYSVPRILDDLNAIGGDVNDRILPSTRAYIDHLTNITPHAMWSHIYVLYMGDLFGGQMIRKAFDDSGNGLPASFLTFENRTPLIAYVRENIADADENEAVEAFRWVIRIYDELYQILRG